MLSGDLAAGSLARSGCHSGMRRRRSPTGAWTTLLPLRLAHRTPTSTPPSPPTHPPTHPRYNWRDVQRAVKASGSTFTYMNGKGDYPIKILAYQHWNQEEVADVEGATATAAGEAHIDPQWLRVGNLVPDVEVSEQSATSVGRRS